jgi:hypothetical protein
MQQADLEVAPSEKAQPGLEAVAFQTWQSEKMAPGPQSSLPEAKYVAGTHRSKKTRRLWFIAIGILAVVIILAAAIPTTLILRQRG